MGEDIVQQIFDGCCERNGTVRRAFGEWGGLTLAEWIRLEREKLSRNHKKKPLQGQEDFVRICTEYVEKRLGSDQAGRVKRALERGAMHTADHLGGIYSPQSLHGDLMFGKMLNADCIPCFAAGNVSFNSGTFGRGILYFTKGDIGKLPLFARKYAKYTASMAPPLTKAAIESAKKKATENEINYILDQYYLDNRMLNCDRFADQVVQVGSLLSSGMGGFFEKNPIIYIENEEVAGRLFIKDLQNSDSLVSVILSDAGVRSAMNREYESAGEQGGSVSTDDAGTQTGQKKSDAEGKHPGSVGSADGDFVQPSLASLLFRAADEGGHMIPLALLEDGSLIGQSLRGGEIRFSGEKEALIEAVKTRKIFVSGYLMALMTCFARGFTWYGGVFQSRYLPRWQERTRKVLERAGYPDLAEKTCGWEADGYISGPIFTLCEVGIPAGAVFTGPVEWSRAKPAEAAIDALLENTSMRAAHEMGCFEFYTDLFPPAERREGWYEAMSLYCKEKYMDHCICSAC